MCHKDIYKQQQQIWKHQEKPHVQYVWLNITLCAKEKYDFAQLQL